jgi:hypothetical protein
VLPTVLVRGLAPVNPEPHRRVKEDYKAQVFDLGITMTSLQKLWFCIDLSPRHHISRHHNRADGSSLDSIDN